LGEVAAAASCLRQRHSPQRAGGHLL